MPRIATPLIFTILQLRGDLFIVQVSLINGLKCIRLRHTFPGKCHALDSG